MTHHSITIEFDAGGPFPHLTWTCNAPADALCRAEYDCECEAWHWEESVEGVPQHRNFDEDVHTGHLGDECRLRAWFEESDGHVFGTVTVPAEATWTGDGYGFQLTTTTEGATR